MEELGLIKDGGFMLDLGCGKGADSDYFIDKGYGVTSVDTDSTYVSQKTDIRDFIIHGDTFDVIIANNVLPFIADKNEVKNILLKMYKGLKKGGIMYFTVFGVNDDWYSTKKSMSFFEHVDIDIFTKTLPDIKILEKTTIEGYGKTMKGDIKYWHIHTYLCKKE